MRERPAARFATPHHLRERRRPPPERYPGPGAGHLPACEPGHEGGSASERRAGRPPVPLDPAPRRDHRPGRAAPVGAIGRRWASSTSSPCSARPSSRPILMGFDPNTAIFFSGIGTLIFFVCRPRARAELPRLELRVHRRRRRRDRLCRDGSEPEHRGRPRRHRRGRRALRGHRPGRHGGRLPVGRVPHAAGRHRRDRRGHRPQPRTPVSRWQRDSGSRDQRPSDIAIGGLTAVVAVLLMAVYAPGLLRRLPILVGGIAGYLLYFLPPTSAGWPTAIRLRRRSRTPPGSACRAFTAPTFDWPCHPPHRPHRDRPRRREPRPRQGGRAP